MSRVLKIWIHFPTQVLKYQNGSSRSRMGRYRLDLCGLGQGQVVDSHEFCNEFLGSMKCREFLDWEPASLSGRMVLHTGSFSVPKYHETDRKIGCEQSFEGLWDLRVLQWCFWSLMSSAVWCFVTWQWLPMFDPKVTAYRNYLTADKVSPETLSSLFKRELDSVNAETKYTVLQVFKFLAVMGLSVFQICRGNTRVFC